MISVGWLDPSQKCWDTNTLRLLLDGDLYPHGLKVRHHAGYPNTDGPVILVVPGRYYAQHTDQINEAIQRFVSVLIVVTSDEEALFPVERVEHSRLKWWIQTPREGRDYPVGTRFIGVGFPPHFNQLPADPPDKDVDVFLSAQKTHVRRDQAFQALEGVQHLKLVEATEGFTQGMPPPEYVACMSRAKVAPAPSGAVSCDSFRFWEAIAAGAVPIADTVSPVDGPTPYWHRLFGDDPLPLPIVEDYAELPALITQTVSDFPAINNRVQAWWMREKRHMALALKTDLQALGVTL